MLRLDVSWDRRKQSGQIDFNAGFTAPPTHLVTLYLASALSGLAAVILAGNRLLWALELTIVSDIGNLFILSVLLPTLAKKVKESKLSVTSTPAKYNVSLVAPDVAWQSILFLSVMTFEAAWNAAIVYGASSSLALLYWVGSVRCLLAMVRLWIPDSVADSKGYNLVSCLVGLHLTKMIGEHYLGIVGVGQDQKEIDGAKESMALGEARRSRDDEEDDVNYVEVDGRDVMDRMEIEGSVAEISSRVEPLIESEMRGSRIDDHEEETITDTSDKMNEIGTGKSTAKDTDTQSDGWDWECL